MKIELLSYRLLRCRFFSLLFCRLVLSLLMLLDDDDDNPFRAYRVSPPVIVLKSAFIVFSLAPLHPQAMPPLNNPLNWKSFLLSYFISMQIRGKLPRMCWGQSMKEISIQYCRLPKHTIPSVPSHTRRRFYWEGFYFFNNNGRDDRHVDRGTTRRPS